MIRTNRWINVVGLAIALIMVSGLPLWTQGDPGIVDYSKLQRFNNLATKAYSLMKKGKYQEAVKPADASSLLGVRRGEPIVVRVG